MALEGELTFKDDHGHLVVINEAVLKVLTKYRQTEIRDNEAAGVLLGEQRGQHIVITDLSEPGSGDIRRRNLVNRKGKHHQQKVDDCFRTSQGTVNYLGEWHTHPEKHPTPSSQDVSSWSLHLKTGEPKVLIIVGITDFWVGKIYGTNLIQLSHCN